MIDAVLLSGGIDSVALVYWKRPACAITVDYGQLAAEGEIAASTTICRELSIAHKVIHADCSVIGNGCMSSSGNEDANNMMPKEWWPYRNQLIVTIAASSILTKGVDRLLIGTVKEDRKFKDGTQEFIQAMNTLLSLQEGGLGLMAPAINLSSVELVLASSIPLSLLAWSRSCHISNYACGFCPGCMKNEKTWNALSKYMAV